MAKKSNETKANTTTEKVSKSWQLNRQQKFAIGVLFALFATTLLLSFVSYFITGNFDQSHAGEFLDRNASVTNWLGKFGAYLAHFFIYDGFGVASFVFIRVIFMIGAYLILDIPLGKLKKILFWDFYIIIVLSILLGFFWDIIPQLSGVVGFEMNLFIQDYIGKIGTLFTLLFAIILFLIFKINLSPDGIKNFFEKSNAKIAEEFKQEEKSPISTPIGLLDNEDELTDEEEAELANFSIKETHPKDDFIIREDEEAISNIELKPTSTFEIDKEALKPTIANASDLSFESKPKVEEAIPMATTITLEDNASDFVVEKMVEEGDPIVLKNVFFETGSAQLNPNSLHELNLLSQWLTENAAIFIQINGHTDLIGAEEMNVQLSTQRAKTVYEYLIQSGIGRERLRYKGYGSSKPVADNATEKGRKENRRTEFILLK